MTSSEQRGVDRTTYFTMKTSGHPALGSAQIHSRSNSYSNSQSFFSSKPTGTPISSPRASHSVGQQYAPGPKLSPGAHRGAGQDVRTPSPNYFGLSIEPTTDGRDSSLLPHENWSPPTSSVKPYATAIPKQMPLDANPEFEAFRRQIDLTRGKGFSLSTPSFIGLGGSQPTLASTPSALPRPRPPPRWNTHGSHTSDISLPRLLVVGGGQSRTGETQDSKSSAETDSLQDSAYGSAGSKRSSLASLNQPSLFNTTRHESPAPLELPYPGLERGRTNFTISQVDDRHPRLSLAPNRICPPSPDQASPQTQRAETVPPKLETGGPNMMTPAELREVMGDGQDADVLLLDLRVSPQFSQARIKGALNLCIPTTLLKRATFNLQKLQQTFQAEQEQEKFANWRNLRHLVVYDAVSSDKRDAVSAMNMVKKFTNEGYSGSTHILRGGFNAFAAAYPDLIDRTSGRSSPGLSLGSGPAPDRRPSIAPVIGGVLLPQATSNPNPFFSNIRQNQDLRDGVGQMDIGAPQGLDRSRLPRWLQQAVEASDHGKLVSDKFLKIELTEKSRMQEAYSVPSLDNACQPVATDNAKIQLSGIEQGGKNRYKDILPFEHARVRLQGRPQGSCDYVNASHIQASRSNKRYIASQGPLPATFEDFWSVIWDQDVRVIVMLTAESEGGQLKCHPYWKGKDFGPMRLRVLSEKKVSLDIDKHRSHPSAGQNPTANGPDPSPPSSQAEGGRRRANTTTTLGSQVPPKPNTTAEVPYVIIRKFALSHAAHPFSPIREITHLHYASWPDFGAPAQPSHLLALVELANVMQRAAMPVDVHAAATSFRLGKTGNPVAKSEAVPLGWEDAPESEDQVRPMLVHCSAGCGRTGAFCTVDSVIDMLKRQRLRAAQRANKRIDDREQLISRQESNDDRVKRQALGRDPDGDVSMASDMNPFEVYDHRMTEDTAQSSGVNSKPPSESGIDLSWMDDDTVDLISRTVEDFRTQRLSMVQSLRQFVLCYETILEWVWQLQDRGSGSTETKGRARSGSLAL